MPQEFYVLRCFSCETFQVHIVKKAKKWECKICGVKQSLKQTYGKGSAKDCRTYVMKLNELRYLKSDTENQISNDLPNGFSITESKQLSPIRKRPLESKWAKYLDTLHPAESDDEESNLLNENKKKRKIKETCDMKSEDRKIQKFFKENHSNDSQSVPNIHYKSSSKETNKTNKKHLIEGPLKNSTNFTIPKSSKYSKYLSEGKSEDNNDLTNIFDHNFETSDFRFLKSKLNFLNK